MDITVYIDESGDTGWNFRLPNNDGGSSRYLTIAYIIVPDDKTSQLPKLVRRLYKKYKLNIKVEKKGASFESNHAQYIATRICDMLEKHPDFKIGVVVVKKENVPLRVQEDKTVIYNYALVNCVAKAIQEGYNKAIIIPDKRTVKVVNGDTLDNYLRIKLHAELLSDVILQYEPRISTNETGLWLIDWIANFTYRHYDQGDSEAFDILKSHMAIMKLFFLED